MIRLKKLLQIKKSNNYEFKKKFKIIHKEIILKKETLKNLNNNNNKNWLSFTEEITNKDLSIKYPTFQIIMSI